jgi:putative PIN family toxin of toxin-antitoxin system
MLKVVLDTNVIVSGLLTPGGKSSRLIGAFEEGKFQLLVSRDIILEIAEMLARPKIRKYGITPERRERIIKTLLKYSLVTPGKLKAAFPKDPADEIFLVCAEEGQADYLVTGDNALLRLGNYKSCQIISIEFFLERLIKNE